MQKLAVVLIAIAFAQVVFADAPKATPSKESTEAPPKIVSGSIEIGKSSDGFSMEEFQKQMVASQEARLPYTAKEVELRLRTQLKVLGDPESAAMLARYIHSLYENLVKEGFSKEEAMQIASRVPFPPQMSGPIY